MTNKEILQRIAYLLWGDAELIGLAAMVCESKSFLPKEYVKKLEEKKSDDKIGFVEDKPDK